MRKVELLPTRDCEASYGPVWCLKKLGYTSFIALEKWTTVFLNLLDNFAHYFELLIFLLAVVNYESTNSHSIFHVLYTQQKIKCKMTQSVRLL